MRQRPRFRAAHLHRGTWAAAKRYRRRLETDLRTGLDIEAELFAALFAKDVRRIGMDSFMADGPGKAQFPGR